MKEKIKREMKNIKMREKKVFEKYAILNDNKKAAGTKIRVAGGFIEGSCCCGSSG